MKPRIGWRSVSLNCCFRLHVRHAADGTRTGVAMRRAEGACWEWWVCFNDGRGRPLSSSAEDQEQAMDAVERFLSAPLVTPPCCWHG